MGLLKSSRAMRRGRGKKRQKVDEKEIPFDLVIEILARLPAKSLMRFKCVSKLWFSLILSRYFSNRYLKVASAPLRLYVSFVSHLDCNSMEPRSLLLSLSSTSATSFDPDLTMPGLGGHNLEVLRGLILYRIRRKARVYNPATRQLVTLPLPPIEEEIGSHVFYFLGHDPVLDQYKVVCNAVVVLSEDPQRFTSECWVFVLETGGSWKRIAFDQPHCPTRIGPCINGVVYYLAINCISRHMVFTFDSRSEEINTIQSPHAKFGKSVWFFEYGGKPAIFHHSHLQQKGFVDLWVLEDGGKWSNQSLVLQPCQMHFVDTDIGTVLTVLGATQDGEVIILGPKPMFHHSYLLFYDLQKNDLRKVTMRGIWNQGFNKSHMCIRPMDKSESIMHLEI